MAEAAAAAETKYHFDIKMTCSGCSGAIDRTLKKMEGVKSYDVSLETQTADIVAEPSLAYETVLAKLKKTGKDILGATKDGEAMAV